MNALTRVGICPSALLAAALITGQAAPAQACQGATRGSIRDQQGVILGAEIALVNPDHPPGTLTQEA